MDIQVLRFHQKGTALYSGVLPARALVKGSQVRVDQWGSASPKGYQRPLQEKRIGEVAGYLLNSDGWMPTSLLLSVRTDLDKGFTETSSGNGTGSYGALHISDEEPIWIIDGQHRLAGLRRAIEKGDRGLEDFAMPVTFVSNPALLDEVRMFYVVNKEAKSVQADIADRILQQTLRSKGSLWMKEHEAPSDKKAQKAISQARAANLVDYLREHSAAWIDFVEIPGDPKPNRKAVRQHTLVSAFLESIFKESSLERLDDDDLGDLLTRYWQAIGDVFPEAIADPEAYSIRRTPGVYGLHMLFPDIFERSREARDYSAPHMAQLLSSMGLDSDFWLVDPDRGDPRTFGTGMKSLRLLADYFRSQLPRLTLTGM